MVRFTSSKCVRLHGSVYFTGTARLNETVWQGTVRDSKEQ
jgi:hypothetical protein